MAWFSDSATGYRNCLNELVQAATSQHISAAAINNDGSGYTAGDLLTITHASAAIDAKIQVLTVDGTGQILTFAIRSAGAFAVRATSATVSAGGTGYAVGTILQVVGGTQTQPAKFQVATLSGSAVATVTLFEGGGAYTSTPSNPAATTVVGPSGAGGTGATLTVTYGTLIGTTNIAATGGTGTGATFDITLTATGWAAVRDRNNFSFNGLLDEKEVVLRSSLVSEDDPIVGFRTYTATVGPDTRWGILCVGMASYDDGIAFDSQFRVGPQVTPSAAQGAYIPLLSTTTSHLYGLNINTRTITGFFKTQGTSVLAYQTFYLGFGNRFATQVENPLPLTVCASCALHSTAPDAANDNITGLVEATSTSGTNGPMWFLEPETAAWTQIRNREGSVESQLYVLYPGGNADDAAADEHNLVENSAQVNSVIWANGIIVNTGGNATRLFKPAYGTNEFLLIPLVLVRTPDGSTQSAKTDVHFELNAVYWVSATKADGTLVTAEDTITSGSTRYVLIPCGHKRERFSFMAFRES